MKLTKLSNLFEIRYGTSEELVNMNEFSHRENSSICFVSRTENNNGVSAFVEKKSDLVPIAANTLSVAVGGSVLSTFLQPYEYYTGFHVLILSPKVQMSERELIYYSICLKKNKYKYNYGRQANKTLKDILVPETVPEKFKNLEVNKLDTKYLSDNKKILSDQNWKWFKLRDLFSFERGKCGSAEKLLEKGDEISYVGAKKEDNGFMYKVVRDEDYVTKNNCIVFIGDGQGSVGYSTYQEDDFIGSTTLSMGRNNHLNKYNALYIITLLDKERFKYSFGRKWNGEKLKNTKIKLPADENGNPDWQFMEDYIKSLSYSASI